MDAKKWLEEIGEEGIAMCLAWIGTGLCIMPEILLDRIQSVFDVEYKESFDVLREIVKKDYLSSRFEEGCGYLYDVSYGYYGLIKKDMLQKYRDPSFEMPKAVFESFEHEHSKVISGVGIGGLVLKPRQLEAPVPVKKRMLEQGGLSENDLEKKCIEAMIFYNEEHAEDENGAEIIYAERFMVEANLPKYYEEYPVIITYWQGGMKRRFYGI